MTAFEVSDPDRRRQAKVRRPWPGILLITAGALACAAPISTQRSPFHLRVVEVRNVTDGFQVLTIEPTADQHLGAATTFTGLLRPGEVKLLYLYHGFEYAFRVFDEPTGSQRATTVIGVDRDMGLSFSGDSLRQDARLVAELGEPTTTFADSLQVVDPFGLRSGGFIEPDTARGRTETREEEQNRRRGISP